MPNTLAHLGIQSVATRAVLHDADHKWIYLGCILPDVSWICQRLAGQILPGIDPYDLRLYVVVQASLLFCLVLSLALATLSNHFWKIFAILSLNSIFHLLLDACQTKWANGVHLLAPLNWELINFNLFWPESLPTYLLTIFGLAYFIWSWRSSVDTPVGMRWRPPMRLLAFIATIALYFSGPFLLVSGPENADNHFVQTLRNREDRVGRHVELDRSYYQYRSSGGSLSAFAGEKLEVEGIAVDRSTIISARGTFVSDNRVRIKDYHVHSRWFRDLANYIGLSLVGMIWLCAVWREKFRREE
jgi:hypothetical protein